MYNERSGYITDRCQEIRKAREGDSMNRNLNTGFNEIKIGINNLSTIMLDQNTRLDEHNIRLEAMQKEHNVEQREHNARLDAILEKLANKS